MRFIEFFKKNRRPQKQLLERICNSQKRIYGESLSRSLVDLKRACFTEIEKNRIDYYLGDIGRKPVTTNPKLAVYRSDTEPHNFLLENYDQLVEDLRENRYHQGYILPVLHLYHILGKRYRSSSFLYRHGDNHRQSECQGVIAKTRLRGDTSVSLLKLKPRRHWFNIHKVSEDDKSYLLKKNKAVWRGGLTGVNRKSGNRLDLVKKYYMSEKIDVAFRDGSDEAEKFPQYIKSRMSHAEQLDYKCIICLEGNDVASGLKWMLNSQSVVMMPTPTISSWLMEDKLEPYVHYIPVSSDFSDLESQFEWAMQNEDKCQDIVFNANSYMKPFLNHKRETLIEAQVIKSYFDNFHIE